MGGALKYLHEVLPAYIEGKTIRRHYPGGKIILAHKDTDSLVGRVLTDDDFTQPVWDLKPYTVNIIEAWKLSKRGKRIMCPDGTVRIASTYSGIGQDCLAPVVLENYEVLKNIPLCWLEQDFEVLD